MVASKIDFVGRTLAGRFEVLSPLGVGNMGLVYLAEDHNLGTKVVVKVPSEESLRDPEFVQRFEVETRSMVHLNHPHVVGILQQGVHVEGGETVPYVVMQYLSGGSLKDRAAGPDGERSPMLPVTLDGWLLEVAKALDFMHGESYIHRDVKPANILFDQHGNPFLSDFGLAKVMSEQVEQASELTAAGFLVGTPNYVAPELVMGRDATPACDQYSLAITVYEVLTGVCPMEGPTASATMVNQTSKRPAKPESIVPGLPAALSRTVLRGLAKDPSKRFKDCVSFARSILAAATDSSPSTPARNGAASRKRRPTTGTPPQRPAAPAADEWDDDEEWEDDDWGAAAVPAKLPPRTSKGKAKSKRNGPGRGKVSKSDRPGRVRCPSCKRVLPLKPEFAGRRGRCIHCQTRLEIGKDLRSLTVVGDSSAHLATQGVRPKTRSGDTSRGGSDGTSRTARDDLVLGEKLFGLDLSKRTAAILCAVLVVVLVGVAIVIGRFTASDDEAERKDEVQKAVPARDD